MAAAKSAILQVKRNRERAQKALFWLDNMVLLFFSHDLLCHPSIHPHLLSSTPWSNFLSTFDGQILYSVSPLVSVQPPATTLFITVSILPQALGVLWALPSYNDQMWLGP